MFHVASLDEKWALEYGLENRNAQYPSQAPERLRVRQGVDDLAAVTSNGCSCSPGPTYYVVIRQGAERPQDPRRPRRKQAERALRKIHVDSTTATTWRSETSRSRGGAINGSPPSSGSAAPSAPTSRRSRTQRALRRKARPADTSRRRQPLQPSAEDRGLMPQPEPNTYESWARVCRPPCGESTPRETRCVTLARQSVLDQSERRPPTSRTTSFHGFSPKFQKGRIDAPAARAEDRRARRRASRARVGRHRSH